MCWDCLRPPSEARASGFMFMGPDGLAETDGVLIQDLKEVRGGA